MTVVAVGAEEPESDWRVSAEIDLPTQAEPLGPGYVPHTLTDRVSEKKITLLRYTDHRENTVSVTEQSEWKLAGDRHPLDYKPEFEHGNDADVILTETWVFEAMIGGGNCQYVTFTYENAEPQRNFVVGVEGGGSWCNGEHSRYVEIAQDRSHCRYAREYLYKGRDDRGNIDWGAPVGGGCT